MTGIVYECPASGCGRSFRSHTDLVSHLDVSHPGLDV